MPTIICPACRTENRPAGLSGLDCEQCHQTIDPRRLDESAESFVRHQRKLRKRSRSLDPLGPEKAGELLEWVVDLPPDETQVAAHTEPHRRSSGNLAGRLTPPWRWMTTGRRQRPEWLYEDSVVRMGEDGIAINRYYWPFGRKRIRYAEIRDFTARPLAAWHGQFRVHGVDHLGRWYSRDRHRGEKERAIDLTVGRVIRPVLTPDDPDKVLAILEQEVDRAPA